MTMPIPERHGLTDEEERQRLVEFKKGDTVAYRVMANTGGVVVAVCRRKFPSKSRIQDWWIGQQLVKVHFTYGCTLLEGEWIPANLFRLVETSEGSKS